MKTPEGVLVSNLFEQVFHQIEGSETEIQNWHTPDGIKLVELQSFGPDRWIESVHENGRLMAIDCLAIILFVVSKSFNKGSERRIVDAWAIELRKAVSTGEIQARDPVTLLALETLPDGWEWLLSMTDADKFIAVRGMGWRFDEIALHLFKESEQAIQKRRFPPWVWETEQPEPTQTAPPAPVVAESASNSTTPDPERRLARLRELGGNATYKRSEWKITGISALVASEKNEGRKRSDEKTIRADLKEAAENEREAKRANAFSGLGQR